MAPEARLSSGNLTFHEALNNRPCIGCNRIEQSLHFMVQTGSGIESCWHKVDVCSDCAGKLTAEDLHRLVDMPEEEAEAAHG